MSLYYSMLNKRESFVELSAGCYVGTGTSIANKVRVGELVQWSIIGRTIIHDVEPNTTAVSVPGRETKTQDRRLALTCVREA